MSPDSELVRLNPMEAVQIGANSLSRYGKMFFPRTVRQEGPLYEPEMDRRLMSMNRYNAFSIFRDGAKTSKLRIYTSQRMAYGMSRTIGYVSISQRQSMFSLRWLRRQVEHNKPWANTFGLTKGDKWTDEWMEVNHNLREDEFQPGRPVSITCLALGITGQIRGFNPEDFRFDLLVIDDILDEENTATPDQRKKIDDLLFGALLNSLAPASEVPTAKAVFLNTPMNKEDAMAKCAKDPSWQHMQISVLNEAQESNWPARYPTATIMKEKEAHIARGQYRLWMREKECTIVSGEEKAIDVTKLQYWDVLPEGMDKIISIDPASSDSPGADKHATVALGFKGLDVYVIAAAAAEKNDPGKATVDFFNMVLLCHPRKGVVESNAYQRVFKWILEQEMQKRKLFVAMEMMNVRTRNADRIMQTIPGLAAYGHLWLHKSMSFIVAQADDYDPAVKDIADDYLTAIANGIISANPALMLQLSEGGEIGEAPASNEDLYKPLRIESCP